MRAARSRVTYTRTAERPGNTHRSSEDRAFITNNAAIILDGASQPDPAERDGGWLADTLGRFLREGLSTSPTIDLSDLLGAAIATTARQYSLTPKLSPSTTVSMARWHDDTLDVLVLGDSLIAALTRNGELLLMRDDRLSHVAQKERQAFRGVNSGAFGTQRPQEWRDLVEAQRRQRNVPGGYWIAEAVPGAAMHARRAQWSLDDITTLMLMTDGVSCGVDRYGVPATWVESFSIARRDPSELLDLIHEAEESDGKGIRWPRSKCHDDKALVIVEFSTEVGSPRD